MDKNQFRKQYFKRLNEYRKNNDPAQAELSIKSRLHDFFNREFAIKSFKLMAYQPFKSELPILQLLNGLTCEIFIPKIEGKDLISESVKTGLHEQIYEMDFVITPGLFVDDNGYRLGRGGGYYDRLLSKYPVSKTVFVGYNWQVVKSIPLDSWDKPVGYLITEKSIRKCFENILTGL